MAQRHSPSGAGSAAERPITEKAQALRSLAQEVLRDYRPEMGAMMDIPQAVVGPQHIAEVCLRVKEHPQLSFKMLLCLAGVDYKEHIQLVYVLLSLEHEHKLVIKTNVPHDNPRLPSVSSLWRGAGWYEREAHDLFGVEFEGNPDLKPLILYEGFQGFPGRKDFPFHDYQEY